ncbi:CAP domain-containing protein [Streptomyces sp. NPDC048638]|uniref:CAP domain-containing protein n=1 Tax=Streptomyces sp. NPDC048638 TaxID=3365580 RepID=UPI00371A1823
MGRHRRSAPLAPEPLGGRPPVDSPSAASPGAAHHGGRRAARARRSTPVRTGLLGASAAVAMGAVAVASGLIPGGGQFEVGGGDHGERVRADSLPDTGPDGGNSAAPTDRATQPASRGGERPTAPHSRRATSAASPSTSPSPRRTTKSPAEGTGSHRPARTAAPTAAAPSKSAAAPSKTPDPGSTAEDRVLSLVNQERDQAGCSPVTANGQLAGLAQSFSDDMAERDFFDHTDPDGDTPWDRASDLGISDLGGENIARGQADARSVMDSWMHSPGHRANILNCEYKTLGVGVHFGQGGPWWTQDFGF